MEITNSSLLSINLSLERLKLKHTNEIRDLKRRLRESRLHPPLLLGSLVPDLSHSISSNDDSDDSLNTDEEEEEDGVEPRVVVEKEKELTWDKLLEEDEPFGNLVGLVGEMLRRGKEAVIFKVEVEVGRAVLNPVELEEEEEVEVEVEGDV